MSDILSLDQTIFQFINGDLANPVLDWIMPWWRDKKTWIPVYLILAVFLVFKFKKDGAILLLATILTVGVADLASSKGMKPTFKRLRPCNEMAMEGKVIERAGCGSGYSFTSSHATNHFALSVFLLLTLGRKFRRIKIPLLLWAASIAFGQVYVGVHYPFDILVGGLLGTTIGFLAMFILSRLFPNLAFFKESRTFV